MKKKAGSYVISVSAGKGCYRHIRIDAAQTLYDLHEAILDAFEFFDDHAHGFFMDNHAWSDEDSYYAEEISEDDDEVRCTPDYSLNEVGLYPDKKFVYIFDFGEEWRFQCRVLKLLDEPTEETCVVRSTGEAPDQFYREREYDGDEDVDDGE